ncbi:MAG: cell division protein FtsI (penicillin-binding protein 3) [Candidatus Peregrinibacteria bacterium Greene0416_19]|nr:MAG: cell division protein FtsI (penicillin-binding protein 3) [Candidatus Peregrinibacteria bacterium Greene0416_19]
MAFRPRHNPSETQKKRLLLQRMTIVHALLLLLLLVLVARLIELQVVKGDQYYDLAQKQHFSGVHLAAKRGEILGVSSKTGEKNIFATNTTLNLVYVDPTVTDNPAFVAETLADLLLIPAFHSLCGKGDDACPRELIPFYAAAFDPLIRHQFLSTGSLLELQRVPGTPGSPVAVPDYVEAKRLFARDMERRISEKRVTYSPLAYGATKIQMTAVEALGVPGIRVHRERDLIYADPEEVPQRSIRNIARALSAVLKTETGDIEELLRSRDLQYVPIMHRLPPSLTLRIKEAQLKSLKEMMAKYPTDSRRISVEALKYPLRSIALIPEPWRFYPDTTVASHVIGFLNTNQVPQYGIERTYDPQLRGREVVISVARDPRGGQILRSAQNVTSPRDGDTVVLTLDRTIQKELEALMDDAVKTYKADSGQAIVMDPATGRVLAMVNAPLFDSNQYADVYAKEAMHMDEDAQRQIVLEVYHPETHQFIVRDYLPNIFSASGRTLMSEKVQKQLQDLERLYDLRDISRFYRYIGKNIRREVFPTRTPGMWLRYRNDIGVGAYLNRNIQEIYEPGSVMKPVTMAIAIDQGEVTPEELYDDLGPVEVDEYEIRNALRRHYGRVTMTNCLELSINTCMTSVSFKLGAKLFHRYLERFGFGRITGIELDDELTGELLPWREWSRTQLATTSFGQGVSVTPLQMVTAFAALANGGRLMRPSIIDSVEHADGTVTRLSPRVADQVLSPLASETITAMLVSSAEKGFARSGKPAGHRVAAKTGTSQIAGPNGKYEEGSGSTIATFSGYAPVDHPRFVVLVKLDRPKTTIFGVDAAAPVFKKIATFLFNYYGIPPDEKE